MNDTEIVDTIENEAVEVTEEVVKKKRPKAPLKKDMFKPEADVPQSISKMNLSAEQKAKLIHDELVRIIKGHEPLQGVRTTTSINYPIEDTGFTTVDALFDLDSRIAQRAWDYYKYNSDKPTVKGFVDELASIVGIKELHRRVIHLSLN